MNVSRETQEMLDHFAALVLKWTKSINLVSSKSKEDIRERHILDSLQICEFLPETGSWSDLGSGGGFPGIVVGIAAKAQSSRVAVTLVESDQRKCAFLRTASRELGLGINVISKRIEDVPSLNSDVISARALADLDKLLGYVHMHLAPGGVALLPKGENWKRELEIARKTWSFDYDPISSQTNPGSVILKIGNLHRA